MFYFLFILIFSNANARIIDEPTQSEGWRFRFRESYQIHKLTASQTGTTTYQGFSNTLNFWYERRFEWAVGLAYSPMFSSIRTDDNKTEGVDNKILLYQLGFELKYFFPSISDGFYVRPAIYQSWLKTNDERGTIKGFAAGVGLGWEFSIAEDKIGLAPEISYQNAKFSRTVKDQVTAVSIGVHFYNFSLF